MTSEEQLEAIFEKTRIISQRRDYIYKQYMGELAEEGVKILSFVDMMPEDKIFLENYFEEAILPLLSPQVIGKKQPFPFLKNKEIYAVVVLGGKKGDKLGIIPCSNDVFKRLIPGVKGYTDNIQVISIVGRYLEHSRIYMFGKGEGSRVYIASADFMTRNTTKRVEVAAPVYDADIKARIIESFHLMLRDNVKASELKADGNYYHRDSDGIQLNSQEYFYADAYRKADFYKDKM